MWGNPFEELLKSVADVLPCRTSPATLRSVAVALNGSLVSGNTDNERWARVYRSSCSDKAMERGGHETETAAGAGGRGNGCLKRHRPRDGPPFRQEGRQGSGRG